VTSPRGVIISHEFGHHIADELAEDTGWNRPTGKYIELVADCFAGIWAANVWYEGYLDAGDQDEAIAALESIGDPPGFRGTGAHGQPAERSKAFEVGYIGVQAGTDELGNNIAAYAPATPRACIDWYWRYDPNAPR